MVCRKITLAVSVASLLVTALVNAQTPATTPTYNPSTTIVDAVNTVYIDPNTGELVTQAGTPEGLPPVNSVTALTTVTIKKIDDLKFAVMQGAVVKLPETIQAMQSNGKPVELKVRWDPKTVDTTIGGGQNFSGTVEGYPQKVNLSLAVCAPFQLATPTSYVPTTVDYVKLKDYALLTRVKPEENAIVVPRQMMPAGNVTADYDDGIMGTQQATAEQMARFLLRYNPEPSINCTPLELAQYYLDEGAKEGVRGDIAFCQSIHETGWFRYGNQVQPEQNNYCGLGATNPVSGLPVPMGASFATPREGVRAQIQHLMAYACETRPKAQLIDPRYQAVGSAHGFGCAYSWPDLNGRWAVPGTGYGEKIINMYNKMMAQ
ncbi:MAG: glucosaminidase domain-containing protein [bacterium]